MKFHLFMKTNIKETFNFSNNDFDFMYDFSDYLLRKEWYKFVFHTTPYLILKGCGEILLLVINEYYPIL